MRILTAVGAVVAAGGLTIGLMSPATAAGRDPSRTVSVKTRDSGAIGATGAFWGDANGRDSDNPEVLGACDKQADGLRAWAKATWKAGGTSHSRTAEDANGAELGTCKKTVLPNVKDGTTVHIQVCLKHGHHGTHRYCGRGTGVA
ncbi:hypothetical protein [Streptomyces sp. TS71-3]|uniref:hypothetical protein n=1 Tax=Streptomyces sp. TS71-3 TaxID=2733862 RepID=UPI001B22E684|nr:hypothetical protein [Streptomyces sp. TS71-3]GHJ37199.1 hypothetical protein Sm713_28080 [Streptomyces sp. TS71-3]